MQKTPIYLDAESGNLALILDHSSMEGVVRILAVGAKRLLATLADEGVVLADAGLYSIALDGRKGGGEP